MHQSSLRQGLTLQVIVFWSLVLLSTPLDANGLKDFMIYLEGTGERHTFYNGMQRIVKEIGSIDH
jgi:ribosomal protein L31